MKSRTVSLAVLFVAAAATAAAELTVFAAASMSDAMKALAAAYAEEGGEPIRFNFSSSGALARQIEAGAPADLFASANTQWMDWLEERSLIDPETRFDTAGNRLVMIAPTGSGLLFDGNVPGRLAVGDFNGVPSGLYAQQALESMGWIESFRTRLVMGSNVRIVLLYVERGEVPAGIVYASDARASAKVETVGTFPATSHKPIVYPVAVCRNACHSAGAFLAFLRSEKAKSILRDHGFCNPPDGSD